MKSTKISCIIPTCDRLDLLKLTLESVLGQTVMPREILIINNGLKDINFEDINNPDHEKNNIKIFNLPKYAGLAQSLNFGSSIAEGEYLAFLEDDELGELDYINKLSESLSSELNIIGDCISELIGIVSPDDVLHNIFNNFCIGK